MEHRTSISLIAFAFTFGMFVGAVMMKYNLTGVVF